MALVVGAHLGLMAAVGASSSIARRAAEKAQLNQWTAKGASRKGPRQKTSKIVEKCQEYFRHFSTFFAQGKNRQKVSKYFRHVLTIFARHPFSGPFWGALIEFQ